MLVLLNHHYNYCAVYMLMCNKKVVDDVKTIMLIMTVAACGLLKDLVMHEEVRHPLLIGLVGLLKPSMDDQQRSSHGTTNARTSEPLLCSIIDDLMVTIATLAVHVQQAGAAHVIQHLVDMKAREITEMLIEVW